MPCQDLLQTLGDVVEDPEEGQTPPSSSNEGNGTIMIRLAEPESFLLFSQRIPSQNLGFLDNRATTLEVSISSRYFTIHQSPTLLSSNRAAGTTGAVLWKITPLVAEWLSMPGSVLRQHAVLDTDSTVLELGCGISGLLALSIAPTVRQYIATDQSYIHKLLKHNIAENSANAPRRGQHYRHAKSGPEAAPDSNIQISSLDWETDSASALPDIDVLIACDCIYNDALINPFVQICTDICHLRDAQIGGPTVCVIAQQLRSPEIFQCWLTECMKVFCVWRVPDEHLIPELRENSGFVVHLAVLRDALA